MSADKRWFPDDHAGLRDFWRVYDGHWQAILDEAMRAARRHAEFAPILGALGPDEAATQSRASRQRLQEAVDGAWEAYEAQLRKQGSTYAQRGISVAAWYDLMASFQGQLIPLILEAYAGEPARQAEALAAMRAFVDRTMVVITEEYLATKERLIHEQRLLAERNQERYQMLFDNGPVPMWVYDVQTLRFLAVNRAAVACYGYSETEFLDLTIEDIRFPDDIAKLRAVTAQPKQPHSTELGEWRHRKKDGGEITVDLRLESFIFLGRRAHLIVATDVTARKAAARALEQSEERYRLLVAATTSVVFSTDGAGQFARPQPSWDAYTGQSWEEQRGRGWLGAFHPDDRARIAAAWQRAVDTRELFDEQGRLWHAGSGEHRWFVARAVPLFDDAANPREWIATITDIDDEKKAEQPGRFFALALDLLCIAGLDGYFKRLNPAFRSLGWTEAELLARPFIDFVHPDDVAATQALVERLGRGEATVNFENRYRCKDGSYRTLLWSAAVDPSGLIFAAAHDVTEAKREEEERIALNRLLTQRNEELTRASRAKSDFLAMMSHELRTPLNSIIGFSEVLTDGKFGTLNDKQARYVSNVLQSGRHLLALINDLLDLSKIEAGRLEVVLGACDARAAATEALATLMPLADARRVQLRLDPDATGARLPLIDADAARLKQVLYNLVSNAIKFSPPAGLVTVGAAFDASANRVRLSVRDAGEGISVEDRARLFKPFTQLDNARDRGGTGLGLALTRQLVELMGGTVGVESQLGHGSSFFVDLSPHAGGAARATLPAPAHPAAPLALIVDDDPGARELLTLTLSEHGYQTLAAANGGDAIAMARQHAPAVITLDIQLPGIDGWDTLRLLKSDPDTADIPVVMVSISNDRAKAFSLGAVDHLVKPVAREELLDVLGRRNFTTQAKARPVDVLAIDDDPKQLELFHAALEPLGFVVRTALDGRAGVAEALRAPPDLVLLDLVMPGVSGIEVVAALRAAAPTRSVPILMITAHRMSAAERERLRDDVAAVLSKGEGGMEALVGEIDRVLRRS